MVYFNVTKIENNKIYINNILSNFPLRIKTSYDAVISSFNVNNICVLSNRYKLSNNSNFNYPEYDNSTNNLNILFFNNDKTNNYTYNYNENKLTKVLSNNRNLYLTKSDEVYEIINKNELWLTMNKQFFGENYIRFKKTTYNTDTYSVYLDVEDLNLDIYDNVLIEQVYNNSKYQHYVDIEIKNNFMKIKYDYVFDNIDDSEFFLHKIIPIKFRKIIIFKL